MFLFPIPLANKTLPPTPSRRKIIPGSAPIDLRYMYLFDFFPEAVMVFDVMAATLPVRNVFPYTRFTQTSLTGLTHKLHLLVTLTPRHGTLIALRVAWGVSHDRVLTLYTKYIHANKSPSEQIYRKFTYVRYVTCLMFSARVNALYIETMYISNCRWLIHMCKREYIVNIIICLLRGCRQVSNNNLLINYCYSPNTIFYQVHCRTSKDSDNMHVNQFKNRPCSYNIFIFRYIQVFGYRHILE